MAIENTSLIESFLDFVTLVSTEACGFGRWVVNNSSSFLCVDFYNW